MMALRVGVIGCGDISDAYFSRAPLFRDFFITACADLRPAAAEVKARRYGVEPCAVDRLLASDDVDIVLNLTVPAAHAEVALNALQAGKHVYGEKPLATSLADGEKILALAQALGLRVGSAPDTVLGAGYQEARALIDAGALGRPLTGLAAFLSHGMEHWHPNPDFFFKPGAGPVFDMGPYYITALVTLLGPVTQVQAVGQIGFAERVVTTVDSPMRGQAIRVETLTTAQAFLTFANGAQVTFLASWDVWRHGLAPIELHGEKASLRLPDPNTFGGQVLVAEGRGDWRAHATDRRVFGKPNDPGEAPNHANYRGLGLADMARGIVDKRPHRASGELALHTLAIMEGILIAATERKTVAVAAPCERPAALGEAEAAGLLRG
jgi:predicted dehydrogenase